MLHHGGQGNGHDGEHRADEGLAAVHGKQTHAVLMDGDAEPGGGTDGLVVHRAGDEGHRVGNQHADEDGQDLDHALAPDVADDDRCQGHKGQQPVGLAVGNGAGGQDQADGDDDGAGDHRREEAHHFTDAEGGDQRAEQHVDQAGQGDRSAGVGQILGVGTAVGDDGEAAQVGKAGTQERGHLALAQKVEQQRAQTCAKQRGADAQARQQRDQHRCAKHGKHVLGAQNQQLGRAQGFGIVNAFGVIDLFAHDILLSVGGAAGPAAGRTQRTKAAKKGNSCVFNNCSLAFLYSIAGFAGNCKMEEGIW